MDASPRKELSHSSNTRSQHYPNPCADCRALDCHSIHGFVRQECLLEGCHICADLARIDDEITDTYARLSELVKERQQIMEKPRHDPIIHCIPVEILSSIFIFVKEAVFDFKFVDHPGHIIREAPDRRPSPSPPLLVGAVCKRWRDVSVLTPQLWTDIIIDLDKSEEGQLDIIERWVRRSGSLLLDITLLSERYDPSHWDDRSEYVDLLSALGLLAHRWNDIALYIPAFICCELLNTVKEMTGIPINTLFLYDLYGGFRSTNLQHSLHPRILKCSGLFGSKTIFIEWSRLVCLQLKNNGPMGEILHIISHAYNLQHCIAGSVYDETIKDFPIPASPVTNHSLVYFDTFGAIIRHLTLPSLQHFKYTHYGCRSTSEELNDSINTLIAFLDRSSAPLENCIYDTFVDERYPFPPFERLLHITSLVLNYTSFPDLAHWGLQDLWTRDSSRIDDLLLALNEPSPTPILPRLKELSFIGLHMSNLTWSFLGRLVSHSNQGETPFVCRRPLSQVHIRVFDLNMDKNNFLCLLAARRSGMGLSILDYNSGVDLFLQLSQKYGVVL